MTTIICGDALTEIRKLPSESVHCCVTSPPYWGLRDYGTAEWEGGDATCDHKGNALCSDKSTLAGYSSDEIKLRTFSQPFRDSCGKCGARRIDAQLGLEKTPEEYVAKMVEVFREVRRVLRKDGTLWLNLGDSYAGSGKGLYSDGNCYLSDKSSKQKTNVGSIGVRIGTVEGDAGHTHGVIPPPGLKPKDLIGIPWRVAFALQADGWWLRSDIIWAKPNPMPESVTDRPTKAHEYLFLLSKSANYFYDAEAIKEKAEPATVERSKYHWCADGNKASQYQDLNGLNRDEAYPFTGNRNKRTVWTVATAPYPEAHFATYPPDLIKPCILAGTSARGCCPKCGAPWERMVEKEPNPKGILGGEHREIYRDGGLARRGERDHEHEKRLGESTTIGWQPTCKCDKMQQHVFGLQPCTVLDCFAGSGTTGAVALELGRKAILIELNPKYIPLIEARCSVTPGLALA